MIHRIEFWAMGCHMSAALESDRERAGERLERLPFWFNDWESRLSRFREDSELSEVNRSAGRRVQVSPTFWKVFQAALDANEDSGGLVTPLVLDALVSAGYDRSWEALTPAESVQSKIPHVPVPTLNGIEWEAGSQTIGRPPGKHLDFGGVAKGWAAHQAMLRLQLYGPVLVDAGGDISISGLQSGGRPWTVGVVDPFQPEADLELLRLGHCGVATSGRDYRRWRQGQAWQHHIIDPRTGQPVESDVLSATVVAPTVMEAEMAAKTTLILGSEAGLNWLEERPAYAGLLVLEDGRRYDSQRMKDYLWS